MLSVSLRQVLTVSLIVAIELSSAAPKQWELIVPEDNEVEMIQQNSGSAADVASSGSAATSVDASSGSAVAPAATPQSPVNTSPGSVVAEGICPISYHFGSTG